MARPRSRERGIALLLVMWIFMILGVIALDFTRYMRDDAMAAVNFADETRGYYVALAGMNRAIFEADQAREQSLAPQANPSAPATAGTRQQDAGEGADTVPADGQWHEGTFAGAHYAVRMTDEGGRISLNKADEILLTRVVTSLVQGGSMVKGADRRTANDIATVVDSIQDWRDVDNQKHTHGAESDYYLKRRKPYRAKNGFFDSPEELLLVRGVTPALFYGGDGMPGLRDVFSVYNKAGMVNVRTASAAVLQALLGIDPDAAADLVAQRDGDADFLQRMQAQVSAIDPHLVNLIVDQPAHIVLLEGRADTQAPRNQSNVAAVVEISPESAEGAKVLRWLDRAPWESTIRPGVRAGDDA